MKKIINLLSLSSLVLGGSFLANAQEVSANNVLYVTQSGAGLKNGSSWANALSEVADALKYAKQNETTWTATKPLQIWVAKGTYNPLYDPADNNFGKIPGNKRNASFLLVNNVQLYGGFAGTETTLTARNWETNKTILSGDIGKVNDITDNTYNVVISFGESATKPITANTVLDGFTISGGNADIKTSRIILGQSVDRENGGGVYNIRSSPMITNVIISGNTARYGGGMNSLYDSPTLTNVTLSGNTADNSGGGMYNNYSSPTLTNVTISGNTANTGGGMFSRYSSPTLTNVTISGNTSTYNGGGVYNWSSSPILTNVTISGNMASTGDGAMINNYSSKPKIYNSIILGNNGGIYNVDATKDAPEIKNSLVQGLESTDDGNISAKDVKATDIFVNPILATASNPTTAGNFRLKEDAMVIDKGDNSFYDATKFGNRDLYGNIRIVRGTIDLGAVENQTLRLKPSNNILYVKENGAGLKDGSSWDNALSEVADALKYAKQNQTTWTTTNTLQIWVAKGTYKPLYDPADNNFGNLPIEDPRDVSFLMVNNVQLYGGFAGTETDRNARNWATNKTILSGDLNGDDGANFTNNTDNAYHVVLSFGKSSSERITTNTVLDGFTISGGNASNNTSRIILGQSINRQRGGGMNSKYSYTMLTNVTISGNRAGFNGGGMYILSSSPTLTNVTLSGNTANREGGGMYNHFSSSTLTNVTISGNRASSGGGIFSRYSSSPKLTNVTISGNTSTYNGGGVYNWSSSPILTNVTISGNTAGFGGGMYNRNSSKPKIYNGIILGNNTGIVNENPTNDVPDIQYNLVQELESTDNNNISAKDVKAEDIFVKPVLATAGNPTTDGDFSLKKNNVVINKGDNSLYNVSKFGDKDLAGNPRIYNDGVIDLGAYEYQGTLSVSDLNSNREVKTMVYPNPTTGIFFVKTDKESKAVLYDLSGKLIQSISLKKGENQVDISNLTKGMYLLKTENGTFKVMKK